MNKQFEMEEQQIEDDYAAGLISNEEYREQMRDLMTDHRIAAEEAAMDAYEQAMGEWR